MGEYVCVGVRIHARNVSSPIRVRKESVYGDKSVIIPRIKYATEIFAKRVRPEKRKGLVEEIIKQTVILDGRDKEVQDILDNAFGCYSSPPNDMIYLDLNYLENPSLVEHETIHFLGRQWVMCLPFPRRIVNQDRIAANVVSTLLDREDFSKRHKLGEADKRDFCQKPPVTDWWHGDATLRVVFEHPGIPRALFQPLVIDEWNSLV